ncbi:hypothetical protein D5086_003952 [Populus alba]|uniref:Uncharacterized protein n=1 Tax=Populus alba TaxID=43335 RepID=A0ACC4D5S0_POPAL
MGDFELLSADEINGWKMLLFNVFIVPSQGKLLQRKRLNAPTASDLSTLSLPGPLDENLAIAGFEFTPKSVFPGLIDAGGLKVTLKIFSSPAFLNSKLEGSTTTETLGGALTLTVYVPGAPRSSPGE